MDLVYNLCGEALYSCLFLFFFIVFFGGADHGVSRTACWDMVCSVSSRVSVGCDVTVSQRPEFMALMISRHSGVVGEITRCR